MSRKAYRIKLCWGIEKGECPNLLQKGPHLEHDLESVLEASGWPEYLLDNYPALVSSLTGHLPFSGSYRCKFAYGYLSRQ